MIRTPFTVKAFTLGSLMCFLLAVGGPFTENISKGSYLFIDFTTGGAVFLFLAICLLLNTYLRMVERWRTAGIIVTYALFAAIGGVSVYLYRAVKADPSEAAMEVRWLAGFSFILGLAFAAFLSAILDGLVEKHGPAGKVIISVLCLVLACALLLGGTYGLSGLLDNKFEDSYYRASLYVTLFFASVSAAVYFAVCRRKADADSETSRLCFPISLSRGELIVVYVMMLLSCAIPTMGFSQQILPILPAPIYYATEENKWAQLVQPHLPSWILPTDLQSLKYFYEGAPPGYPIPWAQWALPLAYWMILAAALFFVMMSMMVILRKQWVERERLIYPLVRLPMEMVQESESGMVAPFFRNPLTWIGFGIPFFLMTTQALHNYFPSFPSMTGFMTQVLYKFPFPTQDTVFRVSWAVVGFSYLVNLEISFSLWLFNLLLNCQAGITQQLGLNNTESIGIYGIGNYPDLAHQGMGAIIVMVLSGLWVARSHLKDIVRKALFDAPDVDDSKEMLSYRTAFFGTIAGLLVMAVWLKISGLPFVATLLFLFGAFILYVGLTRIVAEGVGEGVASTISSSFVISKFGLQLLGPSGLVALAFTYVYAGDLRTFVMASTASSLKLTENFNVRMRPLFWYCVAAIVITTVVSCAYILKISYQYGGVNNNSWFFGGGAKAPFEYVAPKIREYNAAMAIKEKKKLGLEITKDDKATLARAGPNLRGWLFSGIGAVVMFILIQLRYTFLWWPLHPLGFPFAPVWLMDQIWFSIFLGWLVKLFVLKYGGSKLFVKLRPLFLGLIMGTFGAAGFWSVIDFFTGKVGNGIFWI